MKIAVCDDLLTDRLRLNDMLNAYFSLKMHPIEVTLFSTADELLGSFRPCEYLIIFLDIYMPGTSGMQAAERIREVDGDVSLIFTTTSADHVIESYVTRASSYILKPYTAAQLNEALDWCLETRSRELSAVEVISGRERRRVLLKDILFIEVYGRECIIHTSSGDIATNKSLVEFEQSLDKQFLRSHRSYIVNMEHIARPSGNDFVLDDEQRVPISSDSASRIKQQFFDWTFERTWESR